MLHCVKDPPLPITNRHEDKEKGRDEGDILPHIPNFKHQKEITVYLLFYNLLFKFNIL